MADSSSLRPRISNGWWWFQPMSITSASVESQQNVFPGWGVNQNQPGLAAMICGKLCSIAMVALCFQPGHVTLWRLRETLLIHLIHYHHERAFVDSVEFSRLQSTRESRFSRCQVTQDSASSGYSNAPKESTSWLWGEGPGKSRLGLSVSQTLGQIHSFATCSRFCK